MKTMYEPFNSTVHVIASWNDSQSCLVWRRRYCTTKCNMCICQLDMPYPCILYLIRRVQTRRDCFPQHLFHTHTHTQPDAGLPLHIHFIQHYLCWLLLRRRSLTCFLSSAVTRFLYFSTMLMLCEVWHCLAFQTNIFYPPHHSIFRWRNPTASVISYKHTLSVSCMQSDQIRTNQNEHDE